MKLCSKRFRRPEEDPHYRPNRTTVAKHFGEALPIGPGRIYPDLLPENVRGSNLRGLLSKPEWDQLRLSVGEAAGMRCTVCGQLNYDPQRGRPRRPDCHPLWQFAASRSASVQRLAALAALCIDCHRVQHLDRANTRGELPLIMMHLRAVNCWNDTEIRLALDDAGQRYRWRQQYDWDLDLSMLAGQIRIDGYPGLVIPTADRPGLGNSFNGKC